MPAATQWVVGSGWYASGDTQAPTKQNLLKILFSVWIIDNKLYWYKLKGTMEMDINPVSVWNMGEDFWGFCPSNIRIGMSYVPINKLNVDLDLPRQQQPLYLRLLPSVSVHYG
jgi:hypothetical protein